MKNFDFTILNTERKKKLESFFSTLLHVVILYSMTFKEDSSKSLSIRSYDGDVVVSLGDQTDIFSQHSGFSHEQDAPPREC